MPAKLAAGKDRPVKRDHSRQPAGCEAKYFRLRMYFGRARGWANPPSTVGDSNLFPVRMAAFRGIGLPASNISKIIYGLPPGGAA